MRTAFRGLLLASVCSSVLVWSAQGHARSSKTTLTISSPVANAAVSGTINVTGSAGSEWVNVAAYDVNGNKIGSDVTPSGGSYSISVNTTLLANGSDEIQVTAFSVPAGQSGGTSATADVTVNVNNNAAPSPTPTPTSTSALSILSPVANATVSGTINVTGVAGSEWVNVAAYDVNGNKIGNDVTPSNGAYSISVNTTQLANGSDEIQVFAFSVPAGQSGGTSASANVTVDVSNSTSPSPTPTAASGSFPIILGVNTHLFYSGYTSDNASEVQSMMSYLGVSNLRDVLPDTSQFSQLTGLAAQGVNWDIVTEVGGTVNTSTPISVLSSMESEFPGHLSSIEGPNEVVNWPITYNGVGGLQGAANYQAALYSAVKGTSAFNGIPVYDLTMGGGTPSQMPDQASSCNYGNAHIYPQASGGGGITPGSYLAANVPYETPYTSPDPNVVTETGYYTMPDNQYGVNNDVQARYTLDLIMDGVAQGLHALYIYELVDDASDPNNTNMEDHFGLFNADYTPKPAATAISNLTSVLNGTTVSSASYSLSGLPSDGYFVALTGNGASYLVVWAEPVIWNQNSDTQSTAPTENVKASLGATYSSVQVYDPYQSASPINSYSSVSSVTLGITDHPLIVKMVQ
jgi:hypothetical protein